MYSGSTIAGSRYLPAATMAVSALLGVVVGCSNSPPAFESPNIDAAAATEKAFELYDKNGDLQLDEQELTACPGVLAVVSEYDAAGDKQISKDEMIARIEEWSESPPMMSLDCRVTLAGRPLAGATVAFDPEPYLADDLPPARGVTNASGSAAIGIPADKLDRRHRGVVAFNPGVYKIRITHPEIQVPAKYNEQTTLGLEMSMQTRPAVLQLELSRD